MTSEEIGIEPSLFKKAVNAEAIDLSKLGWIKHKDDKQIFSYIRGYVWRNYNIRIKQPLDLIMFFMLDDVLSHEHKALKAKDEETDKKVEWLKKQISIELIKANKTCTKLFPSEAEQRADKIVTEVLKTKSFQKHKASFKGER